MLNPFRMLILFALIGTAFIGCNADDDTNTNGNQNPNANYIEVAVNLPNGSYVNLLETTL